MATQTQDIEKIIWVQGNTQSLIIPMEQKIIPAQGGPYTEDFYPAEDDVVKVILTGAYRPFIFTPEIDGHLLVITDEGTLPKGCYGVQVTVIGANGEMRLRSFWNHQIIVTKRNNSVLKEWDEFKDQPVTARAAVFFFAKGDKGDPFTYQDFTPEQIEELEKPARDAAAEITEDYNTNVKEDYGEMKEDYNTNVKEDYGTNVKDDYATVKQDAQQATSDANDAAQNANDKAGEANSAAQDANDKGTYAKNQGDYAKRKADEIEDAKGTYQTLDARLDAMDAATDDRLEAITTEQLNAIFN
jgi:hypothetical protein